MLHTRWSAAAWSQVRVEFKEGARAQEPDPARRVVQLIVTDRCGRLLLVTLEVARGRPRRADRYRPACELRRGRLRRASLYIPELETHNVKRNGPPGAPATRQSDLFHRLILRNERVAGVAAFPVAWITPRACDALTRQTTVLELLPDEEQEDLRIQKRATRVADQRNNARFTGVLTPRNVNP